MCLNSTQPYGVINTVGSTYAWSIIPGTGGAGTITGSGNLISVLWTSTGTCTLQVIETNAEGCILPPVSIAVTVNPLPVVTATPASQSICSGQTTSIALSSDIPGTTFAWTVVQTTGTASGFTPGSGNTIAQTLTNTTNAVATVTYTVTPTTAGGCVGAPLDVVITVFPVITVTANPTSESICSGATTNIALTANTGTATFSWTAVNTSGTASGFSAGSGPLIAQTLSNTTNTLATVTYTITPSDNGCPGTPLDVVVTVYPAVTVTATPPSESICSDATTNIALTSNTGTATFSWTAALTSGTASGFSNGSGALIAQTLTNTTNTSATVTYTITPSDNGCPGTPITVVVSVFPTIVATATPATQSICSGATTNIALTANTTTPTFTWTAALTSGTATGFSDGSGPLIAQSLTNTTNTNATVTYTVTPADGSCVGEPISVVITVYPAVTATATPPAQSICSDATTGISLTSNTGTATFAWTAALTSGVASGFSDGTGASIAQTLINTTSTVATVTYTITPSDNGCPGTPITVVVTVFPTVVATATPNSEAICSGATTNIALTSNTGTATFSWTAALTSGSATGFSDGSGALIAQTLVNSTTSPATVTYTITPSDNGCPGTPITVVITINPLPVPTITGPTPVCQNSTGNIYSTETGMTNYVWTITGGTISGGQGTASITVDWTSYGTFPVTVTYTDPNGCNPAVPTTYPVVVNQLVPTSPIYHN